MERQNNEPDSKRVVAREYIDRIIAINRRHGMGDQIAEETYNRAIEEAARALTLRPQVKARTDLGGS